MANEDFDLFKENFLLAVDFDDPPQLDENTKLSNLPGFDSIAMLGTIVMFELEFGKTITAENIMSCDTLYDLYLLGK